MGVNDAWRKFREFMREIIEENILKYKRTNRSHVMLKEK